MPDSASPPSAKAADKPAQQNPEFEASYARVFGNQVRLSADADEFFDAFYRRFLHDPAIAERFASTQMAKQVQMMRKSLFNVVSYYLLSDPTPEFERLAKIHADLNLQPWMFDSWLNSLVNTVAEFDPRFTETTRLAWCWAMTPGITFMRMHATPSGWSEFINRQGA